MTGWGLRGKRKEGKEEKTALGETQTYLINAAAIYKRHASTQSSLSI